MTKINKFLRFAYLPLAFVFISSVFTGAYFSSNVGISGNSFSTGIWNPGKATISEVFYRAVGSDSGKEWIEIKNSGGFSLDMTGYVLHFDGNSHDFTFPNFSLEPGAKVVVYLRVTGVNSASSLYWTDTNGMNMSNYFGSVGLYKNLPKDSSTIVDYVEYGGAGNDGEPKAIGAGIWSAGAFVSLVSDGHSMELVSTDNNLPSDWRDQDSPTRGY